MRTKLGIPVLFLGVFTSYHYSLARTVVFVSLEAHISDADIVVAGRIRDVRNVKPASSVAVQSQVIVDITETLKGDEEKTRVVEWPSSDPRIKQWQHEKSELLFVLRRCIGQDESSHSQLLCVNSTIALDVKEQSVVTMDFRTLNTRDEILKSTRVSIADDPVGKVERFLRVFPPSSSEIMRNLEGGSAIRVLLPVDQRLESHGQKWAISRSFEYRRLACEALAPFKSDKNIAILKQLLLDDSSINEIDENGQETRFFPVRASAYSVLKRWGVEVKKPELKRAGSNATLFISL